MSASRSPADREAAQAVVRHHAQLAADLDRHVGNLLTAADQGDATGALRHRDELLRWLRDELLPHAHAEEDSLYAAAGERAEGALLVRGMLDEHQAITGLVAELETGNRPVRLAGTARALAALFAVHLAKENDLVVPLLVDAADVSLAKLLEGMHDLLGSSESSNGGGCGGVAAAAVVTGHRPTRRPRPSPSIPGWTSGSSRTTSATRGCWRRWRRCRPVERWCWSPRTHPARCWPRSQPATATA